MLRQDIFSALFLFLFVYYIDMSNVPVRRMDTRYNVPRLSVWLGAASGLEDLWPAGPARFAALKF